MPYMPVYTDDYLIQMILDIADIYLVKVEEITIDLEGIYLRCGRYKGVDFRWYFYHFGAEPEFRAFIASQFYKI